MKRWSLRWLTLLGPAVLSAWWATGTTSAAGTTTGAGTAAGVPSNQGYASPIPGSRLASPRTQIAFRGINPAALTGVTVTGSRSGPHPGNVYADSDGKGASFVPGTPFQPGETVSVKTGLNI